MDEGYRELRQLLVDKWLDGDIPGQVMQGVVDAKGKRGLRA